MTREPEQRILIVGPPEAGPRRLRRAFSLAGLRVVVHEHADEIVPIGDEEYAALVLLGPAGRLAQGFRARRGARQQPLVVIVPGATVALRLRAMGDGASDVVDAATDATFTVARVRELASPGQRQRAGGLLLVGQLGALRRELASSSSLRMVCVRGVDDAARAAAMTEPDVVVIGGLGDGTSLADAVRKLRAHVAPVTKLCAVLADPPGGSALELELIAAGADAVASPGDAELAAARVEALVRASKQGSAAAWLAGWRAQRILEIGRPPAALAELTSGLRALGRDVAWATTLREAMPLPVLLPVDCVLLSLDAEAALAACKELRRSPRTHDVPIVVIAAAAARPPDERALAQAGADCVIQPGTPLELAGARVQRILARRQLDVERRDVLTQLFQQRVQAADAVVARELAASRAGMLAQVDQSRKEAELTADRLQRELGASERDSAARSRFFSTVTHELRTPLTAIVGFGKVLERSGTGLDDKQRRYLSDIVRSGGELQRLIDDLLDLLRLREGRHTLTAVPGQLAPLCEHALRMVWPLAEEQGHTLSAQVPTDLPACLLDQRALLHVLTNLLTNAIKYTPRGGRIELRAVPGDGHVVVEVEDNGIGIKAEDQERVFEYFEQAQSVGGPANAPHPLRGAGIGLALVRAMVEKLGGSVGVRSEPGRGSVFSFTLQRAPTA